MFVDTNILVYAHDRSAGARHTAARDLLARLWRQTTPPTLSPQVLLEFYVILRRKGVPPDWSHRLVKLYACWNVTPTDRDLTLRGLELSARWQLSPWDAMVLASAERAGETVVLSEDMTHGQDYGGVRVVNPFVAPVEL